MSASHKHHFLPKFYLKGFVNDIGKFYIYLNDFNKFKRNGKLFHPSSHFYIEDDNTAHLDNKQSDFVENLYAKKDDFFSGIFKKLQDEEFSIPKLSQQEIVSLEYFIATLFWRLPSRKQYLKNLIERYKLKELGIVFKNENGQKVEDAILEDRIKKSGNAHLMLKTIYPGLFYPLLFERTSKLKLFNLPVSVPKLIGTNPIIIRNDNSFSFYKEDFTFPLTSNTIIVRGDKINEQVVSSVKLEMDICILMQSEYCACTDLLYPKLLKQVFYNEYKTVENLKNIIFSKLL